VVLCQKFVPLSREIGARPGRRQRKANERARCHGGAEDRRGDGLVAEQQEGAEVGGRQHGSQEGDTLVLIHTRRHGCPERPRQLALRSIRSVDPFLIWVLLLILFDAAVKMTALIPLEELMEPPVKAALRDARGRRGVRHAQQRGPAEGAVRGGQGVLG
jgi:hypothetical protein